MGGEPVELRCFLARRERPSRKHGSIAWTTRERPSCRVASTCPQRSPPASLPMRPSGRDGRPLSRGYARAYLGAAGLELHGQGQLAREIIDRLRRRPAATGRGRGDPRRTAAWPGRLLTDKSARDRELANRRVPGASRSAAEHPAACLPLGHRLAARRLTVAAPPAGPSTRSASAEWPTTSRAAAAAPPCAPASAGGIFTLPDPRPRRLGGGELRRDPRRRRPELPRPDPDCRVLGPDLLAGAVLLDARRRCGVLGTASWPRGAGAAGTCRARGTAAGRDRGADLQRGHRTRLRRASRRCGRTFGAAPQSDRFDLFMLSDTTDPDLWLAELDAWQRLRQAVPGGERIFYRRRSRNLKRKTGNIEDFVTALGRRLRLHAGARRRQPDVRPEHDRAGRAHGRQPGGRAHPGAAQAGPRPDRCSPACCSSPASSTARCPPPASATGRWARATTGATTRSSASRRSPSCAACRCCPGGPPFGGEILSHDFVEAALLRRGGWQVWIADDLGELRGAAAAASPTSPTRDRRWCQGNLQHIKRAVRRATCTG